MQNGRLDRWLPRLRGTATFVYIAALCLAVALLVIGFIPGSPVTVDLPTASLPGSGSSAVAGGIVHGVVLDPQAGSSSRSRTRPSPSG